MKVSIDHDLAASKKRRLAIVVTSVTSTIIVTCLVAASTLQSGDIFGAIPKEKTSTQSTIVLK